MLWNTRGPHQWHWLLSVRIFNTTNGRLETFPVGLRAPNNFKHGVSLGCCGKILVTFGGYEDVVFDANASYWKVFHEDRGVDVFRVNRRG